MKAYVLNCLLAGMILFIAGTIQADLPDNPGVQIQWLGHASFKIISDKTTLYIDPYQLTSSPKDASYVLCSHTHSDHYSAADIARVSQAQTVLIGSADVIQNAGAGHALAPGQTLDLNGFSVTGVPAYNTNKNYHPRDKNWLGFVVEIAGYRLYHAGDTDVTPEMLALTDLDVAMLPVGGTYTMTATEAAQATQIFQPRLAIPMHWGTIVGDLRDAETFVNQAGCPAKVMEKGESIILANWLSDPNGPIHNLTSAQRYRTLTTAVAFAAAGDTLMVELGVYNESLTLDKDLTLQSIDPNDPYTIGGTIIQGDTTTPVLSLSNISETCTIAGLTLRAGSVGVRGTASHPTFRNCRIMDNASHGMDLIGSSPHLSHCLITANSGHGMIMQPTPATSGRGIHPEIPCEPLIENCFIVDNNDISIVGGKPVIVDSIIED